LRPDKNAGRNLVTFKKNYLAAVTKCRVRDLKEAPAGLGHLAREIN